MNKTSQQFLDQVQKSKIENYDGFNLQHELSALFHPNIEYPIPKWI